MNRFFIFNTLVKVIKLFYFKNYNLVFAITHKKDLTKSSFKFYGQDANQLAGTTFATCERFITAYEQENECTLAKESFLEMLNDYFNSK